MLEKKNKPERERPYDHRELVRVELSFPPNPLFFFIDAATPEIYTLSLHDALPIFASVIAAFAPSAEMLIVARALLGLSGATIMPSTLSILRSQIGRAHV